jgi:hypothetical protein
MESSTTWTTHIKASPQAAFAELSDVENHHKWSAKDFTAEKTSEGPIGVGTTYKTAGWLPPKGKDWENNVKITAFEPGKRFTFDSVDPRGPVIPSDFEITAEDGGCKVTRTMTFPKPEGFAGVTWPIVFPMLVKPAIDKNLQMFKDVVEKNGAAAAPECPGSVWTARTRSAPPRALAAPSITARSRTPGAATTWRAICGGCTGIGLVRTSRFCNRSGSRGAAATKSTSSAWPRPRNASVCWSAT